MVVPLTGSEHGQTWALPLIPFTLSVDKSNVTAPTGAPRDSNIIDAAPARVETEMDFNMPHSPCLAQNQVIRV